MIRRTVGAVCVCCVVGAAACAPYAGLPERDLTMVEQSMLECGVTYLRSQGYTVTVGRSRARWLKPKLVWAPPEMKLTEPMRNQRFSVFILPKSAAPEGYSYELTNTWDRPMRPALLFELDAACRRTERTLNPKHP